MSEVVGEGGLGDINADKYARHGQTNLVVEVPGVPALQDPGVPAGRDPGNCAGCGSREA